MSLNLLTLGDYRALIYACALVRTHKFDYVIMVNRTVIRSDFNSFRISLGYGTGALCENYGARIDRRLVFHTGSYYGRLSCEKRNRLSLHV